MQETFDDLGESINQGLMSLANAITPMSSGAGKDATGGHVESLTEAVMGVTNALTMIATSIDGLADAVRESKQ